MLPLVIICRILSKNSESISVAYLTLRQGGANFWKRTPVWFCLLAIWRGKLSVVISQLMSKCLWSGWKWWWWIKEIPHPTPLLPPFACYRVNWACSWKKTQYKFTSKCHRKTTPSSILGADIARAKKRFSNPCW